MQKNLIERCQKSLDPSSEKDWTHLHLNSTDPCPCCSEDKMIQGFDNGL